ncbi:UNVERIFIED_CONTAM: hypothetical protein PYX00_009833 [Menopon gallinae]|uniref:Neurotransmitter-gated ion-channel ligand-binding domain-containing protein n=1 Tax=Menopon gallinae TaxID=328185 RepID=A0AAW2HDG1_9NEOP
MFVWIFFFALLNTVSATDLSRAELEKKVLIDIYNYQKFHSFVRPHRNESSADDPVLVSVNLYLLQLSVNGKNQEFELSMYFRQEWNDSRLAYDNAGKLSYIAIHDPVGFWTPDLFFVDETKAHLHTITKPNTFARIYPDGSVLHSQRLSVKSSCPMNLKQYPFDSQNCRLHIESYGYTADDLMLQWKATDDSPVMGSPDVVGYEASYSFGNHTVVVGDKKYSTIELQIHLQRQSFGFILHIYIPITLFVFTSWIPFWMNPKSFMIRLTVSLTTLVSSLLQLNMNNYLFLTPGYPTGLDLWVAFSCTLLFIAFFENVCAVYTFQQSENEAQESSKAGINSLSGFVPKMTNRIDAASKLLFPSLFVAFHLFYIIYIVVNPFDG